MNCLITKLLSSVSDDTIPKIGELKLSLYNIDKQCSVSPCEGKSVTIETPEGQYINCDGTIRNNITVTSWKSFDIDKRASYILIKNYYDLKTLACSKITEFSDKIEFVEGMTSIEVDGISCDIKDLPRFLSSISAYGILNKKAALTGDVKDFPTTLSYINLFGNISKELKGNLNDWLENNNIVLSRYGFALENSIVGINLVTLAKHTNFSSGNTTVWYLNNCSNITGTIEDIINNVSNNNCTLKIYCAGTGLMYNGSLIPSSGIIISWNDTGIATVTM